MHPRPDYSMFWRNAAILLLALLAFVSVIIKSRPARIDAGGTAFSVSVSAQKTWVEIHGDVINPGIYDCSDKSMADCVNNMAKPDCIKQDYTWLINSAGKINSGDSLKISCDSGFTVVRSVGRLSLPGLLMLGIRPDLNKMNVSDFELLAGVGPKLAQRIVEHRQIYGDFHSVYELGNVSGIGHKKLNQILTELNYK